MKKKLTKKTMFTFIAISSGILVIDGLRKLVFKAGDINPDDIGDDLYHDGVCAFFEQGTKHLVAVIEADSLNEMKESMKEVTTYFEERLK